MPQLLPHLRTAAFLLILGGLVTVTGACTSGPQPSAPTPSPEPYYQPFSRDLCGQLRIQRYVAQFDLDLPSGYEPSDTYSADQRSWHIGCGFSTVSGDDRFATRVTRFEPAGLVAINLFREQANAYDTYQTRVRGLELRREPSDATIAPVDGWWDEGQSSEHATEATIDYDIEVDATAIFVTYIAYHKNLYVEASLDATAATDDVRQAAGLLHEMMRALLDEAVSHLDTTG